MQEREQNLLLEVVEGSYGPVGLDPYEIPTKEWTCILDQFATMQVQQTNCSMYFHKVIRN